MIKIPTIILASAILAGCAPTECEMKCEERLEQCPDDDADCAETCDAYEQMNKESWAVHCWNCMMDYYSHDCTGTIMSGSACYNEC